MKILVSSYACNPYTGSEPGVGWGFVKALATAHELFVITDQQHKDDIESYLRNTNQSDGITEVKFAYIQRKRNHLLEWVWPPSYYWTYRRWQRDAFLLAEEMHETMGFDIAHHLTMTGFREPGYLWRLPIPFVWGPVAGMGFFPWRFLFKVGLRGGFHFFGYNILNFLEMMVSNRPRTAARRARAVIAMNRENQKALDKNFNKKSEICVPVGPPETKSVQPIERRLGEPLRIVWAGLHIPRKALNIGLEALARLPKNIDWELHILGDGPLSNKWKHLAEKLNISEKTHFYGQVPRDRVLEVMQFSHVHLLTSLREGTPSVIIEAASFGIPTICFGVSGMIDMVDASSGIRVVPDFPNKSIQSFSNAIIQLESDENFRRSLSRGALEKTDEYSWQHKVEQFNRIYSDISREGLEDSSY